MRGNMAGNFDSFIVVLWWSLDMAKVVRHCVLVLAGKE